MKKIPTLFARDERDRKHVLVDQVTPGCEWVLAGEGRPTRKYDGTCVMRDEHGDWWARREVKPGKPDPAGFVLADDDPATGKRQGWEPIGRSPFAKFHAEALANAVADDALGSWAEPVTYELCGPKINGNPERLDDHRLIPHGLMTIGEADRVLPLNLIADCRAMGWEGVVWHHPDGRMAKLKVRDVKEADRG